MPDLIFGSLVFVPPFFAVMFLGFFLWFFLRGFYRIPLYNGKLWHPALFDISVMVICFYLIHLAVQQIKS